MTTARKHVMRWASIIGTTIATAWLTLILVMLIWPDPSELRVILALIAGIIAFWFAYTGRLARLFRRVDQDDA